MANPLQTRIALISCCELLLAAFLICIAGYVRIAASKDQQDHIPFFYAFLYAAIISTISFISGFMVACCESKHKSVNFTFLISYLITTTAWCFFGVICFSICIETVFFCGKESDYHLQLASTGISLMCVVLVTTRIYFNIIIHGFTQQIDSVSNTHNNRIKQHVSPQLKHDIDIESISVTTNGQIKIKSIKESKSARMRQGNNYGMDIEYIGGNELCISNKEGIHDHKIANTNLLFGLM